MPRGVTTTNADRLCQQHGIQRRNLRSTTRLLTQMDAATGRSRADATSSEDSGREEADAGRLHRGNDSALAQLRGESKSSSSSSSSSSSAAVASSSSSSSAAARADLRQQGGPALRRDAQNDGSSDDEGNGKRMRRGGREEGAQGSRDESASRRKPGRPTKAAAAAAAAERAAAGTASAARTTAHVPAARKIYNTRARSRANRNAGTMTSSSQRTHSQDHEGAEDGNFLQRDLQEHQSHAAQKSSALAGAEEVEDSVLARTVKEQQILSSTSNMAGMRRRDSPAAGFPAAASSISFSDRDQMYPEHAGSGAVSAARTRKMLPPRNAPRDKAKGSDLSPSAGSGNVSKSSCKKAPLAQPVISRSRLHGTVNAGAMSRLFPHQEEGQNDMHDEDAAQQAKKASHAHRSRAPSPTSMKMASKQAAPARAKSPACAKKRSRSREQKREFLLPRDDDEDVEMKAPSRSIGLSRAGMHHATGTTAARKASPKPVSEELRQFQENLFRRFKPWGGADEADEHQPDEREERRRRREQSKRDVGLLPALLLEESGYENQSSADVARGPLLSASGKSIPCGPQDTAVLSGGRMSQDGGGCHLALLPQDRYFPEGRSSIASSISSSSRSHRRPGLTDQHGLVTPLTPAGPGDLVLAPFGQPQHGNLGSSSSLGGTPHRTGLLPGTVLFNGTTGAAASSSASFLGSSGRRSGGGRRQELEFDNSYMRTNLRRTQIASSSEEGGNNSASDHQDLVVMADAMGASGSRKPPVVKRVYNTRSRVAKLGEQGVATEFWELAPTRQLAPTFGTNPQAARISERKKAATAMQGGSAGKANSKSTMSKSSRSRSPPVGAGRQAAEMVDDEEEEDESDDPDDPTYKALPPRGRGRKSTATGRAAGDHKRANMKRALIGGSDHYRNPQDHDHPSARKSKRRKKSRAGKKVAFHTSSSEEDHELAQDMRRAGAQQRDDEQARRASHQAAGTASSSSRVHHSQLPPGRDFLMEWEDEDELWAAENRRARLDDVEEEFVTTPKSSCLFGQNAHSYSCFHVHSSQPSGTTGAAGGSSNFLHRKQLRGGPGTLVARRSARLKEKEEKDERLFGREHAEVSRMVGSRKGLDSFCFNVYSKELRSKVAGLCRKIMTPFEREDRPDGTGLVDPEEVEHARVLREEAAGRNRVLEKEMYDAINDFRRGPVIGGGAAACGSTAPVEQAERETAVSHAGGASSASRTVSAANAPLVSSSSSAPADQTAIVTAGSAGSSSSCAVPSDSTLLQFNFKNHPTISIGDLKDGEEPLQNSGAAGGNSDKTIELLHDQSSAVPPPLPQPTLHLVPPTTDPRLNSAGGKHINSLDVLTEAGMTPLAAVLRGHLLDGGFHIRRRMKLFYQLLDNFASVKFPFRPFEAAEMGESIYGGSRRVYALIEYCHQRAFWEFFEICCDLEESYLDLFPPDTICRRIDDDRCVKRIVANMNWYRRREVVLLRWQLEQRRGKLKLVSCPSSSGTGDVGAGEVGPSLPSSSSAASPSRTHQETSLQMKPETEVGTSGKTTTLHRLATAADVNSDPWLRTRNMDPQQYFFLWLRTMRSNREEEVELSISYSNSNEGEIEEARNDAYIFALHCNDDIFRAIVAFL